MHARVTPFGEVRVLLVEDEPLILFDCEAILASLGVGHVQSATSVPEAKALLDAGHTFDVAILDISLGGTSSFELAGELGNLQVPAGFMSGYSSQDIPEAFRGRPYINKPFAQGQLKSLLEILIQDRMREAKSGAV
jgi:DNA-binding NtrC family response regulator